MLRAEVYVSSRLPIAVQRNGEPSFFSPISCTLIHGPTEAVLIDTPISTSQTEDLVRWMKERIPNKSLKYIYITHGHGDHFFGISTVRRQWPSAQAIATEGTVAHMKQQLEPQWWNDAWLKFFPGNQIDTPVELATPWLSDQFHVDGQVLKIFEVGHADTHDSTFVYVPDLELVVAGDIVYGDVHQYFGEANTSSKRQEWLRAIEKIESLNPKIVIAGHKRPGSVDAPYYLGATKAYIKDFEDVSAGSATAEGIAGAAAAIKGKVKEI
ncbi:hypothetical protein PFICI_12412 [Pestalotiopsis fici W106-1]|uniref:Metallo-beta-lactamase domain-containing protein n=1 Tax=Pestalotiopsis fici (strain W106-1 / CGMCC3.15140) TaxID=1229662 RepID=W3WNN2_PESFW|nr:uncharacterized protein PFICI_12412 [Pestalotiopsis fici W106-1]ETS75468.1 hypothetical protein PFICI_12412 [Pestalotiopsis fici W106-1]